MRRIADLNAGSILAAGIRSQCVEDVEFIKERRFRIIPPEELNRTSQWDSSITEDSDGPTYLTIDMDFFDPSEAPGVGTPEPGGVTYQSGLSFVQHVAAEKELVAFDIVECMPRPGCPHTETLAARLIYELVKSLAEKPRFTGNRQT